MDTNKIAEIIHKKMQWADFQGDTEIIVAQDLIDALADYFEAEGNPCDCDGKRTQYPCIDACASQSPWDRAEWVRTADGT